MVVVLGIFQITFFIFLVTKFYTLGSAVYILMTIFSIGVMMYLFERDNLNPSYKMLWVVVMLFLPVTGALFYFLWGDTKLTKKQQAALRKIHNNALKYHKPNDAAVKKLAEWDAGLAKQARFLNDYAKATP